MLRDSLCLLSISRSVWEQDEKPKPDTETTSAKSLSLPLPNIASQSSKLYGSQDSIYYSTWSLLGPHDADEPVTKTTTNQEIVPTEYNSGWSKPYEQQSSSSQRSIWSPALPASSSTVENVCKRERGWFKIFRYATPIYSSLGCHH